MSRLHQIGLVARREILERSRSTVFRVMMVVMVLVVAGGIIAVSFINTETPPISIGLVGEAAPGLEADIEAVATSIAQPVDVTSFSTTEDADAALADGTVEVLLKDGSTVVTANGASTNATIILSTAVTMAGQRAAGLELGLSVEELATILQPVPLQHVETDAQDLDADVRTAFAFFGAILLFVTIMMFGQFVAFGIVEEKQNRVVEVVLSRIDSTSILIGKVLGIGALGLIQVGAVVFAAVGALLYVGSDVMDGLDLSVVGIAGLISLIFWFILGYLMFSFIYAMTGATVSRLEDLQSVAIVPVMLLMPGYMIATISTGYISTWVRVASMVPLWAPVVMPVRIAQGDAAWWEVALAIGLIAVLLVVVVTLSARVYRGAVLRTGGRVKFKEALRGSGV